MSFLKKLVMPVLTAALLLGGAIAAPAAHAKAPTAVTASAQPGAATARKLPPRGAKGRFVSTKHKTTKAVKKAKSAKKGKVAARKLPARDAHGRFIKASPAPSPVPGKKLPARNAKGRFVSHKKGKK